VRPSPRVRIGFMDPAAADRPVARPQDRHFDDKGFNDSDCPCAPPSSSGAMLDLIRALEGSLSVLADYIGPHKICGDRLPASDGFFPARPR